MNITKSLWARSICQFTTIILAYGLVHYLLHFNQNNNKVEVYAGYHKMNEVTCQADNNLHELYSVCIIYLHCIFISNDSKRHIEQIFKWSDFPTKYLVLQATSIWKLMFSFNLGFNAITKAETVSSNLWDTMIMDKCCCDDKHVEDLMALEL